MFIEAGMILLGLWVLGDSIENAARIMRGKEE